MRTPLRGHPLVVLVAVVALGAVVPVPSATAAPAGGLPARAAAQIAALQEIKRSITGTDTKVDSALIVEQRRRKGSAAFGRLPSYRTGVEVRPDGTVSVDVRAVAVTPGLVASLGDRVRSVSVDGATIRAEVPLSAVGAIAARPDVRRVQVADAAPVDARSKEEQAGKVEADTLAAVDRTTANRATADPTTADPTTAESDRAHGADTARATHKVTGTGVKICVLANGITDLAAAQAAGELPEVEVLPGEEGGGYDGVPLLEIVHDIAPGASLGFATAGLGDARFADNIRALRSRLRCDILVDNGRAQDEPQFQDGVVARAVDAVAADGALYFAAAGDEGNVTDGTSGHWEGDFVDSGVGVGKFAGTAHDFDPSPTAKQVLDPLAVGSGGAPVTLSWADPLGAAGDDYDLYLVNAQGNVVGASQNVQDGAQDPVERLHVPDSQVDRLRLAVVKFRGEHRYLGLTVHGGRFANSFDGLKGYTTAGAIRGHAAAKGAIAVGAAPVGDPYPGDPAHPRGPYPGVFDVGQRPERFTSDGPRRVFFAADGTPRTEVRPKPDVTAGDGVKVGGSVRYGTSVSAPAAAAIAGLVLSGNPGLPAAQVREALATTALDLVEPGVDGRTGAGVLRADLALDFTGASPQPLVKARRPTPVNEVDGTPYFKPGTTAAVTVPVHNSGDGLAASTNVVLTSPTPGVTIAPRARSYGTIEQGRTGSGEFKVTVAAGVPLGTEVKLDVRVAYSGATSPTTASFGYVVGEPSAETRDFSYTGPAIAIPDDNATGVTATFPVSGLGRASKITFSVDGEQCTATEGATTVGVDHTFVGDLTGTLTSPSGRTATLFQRSGGTGANLCQVVFADDAARPFSSVTSVNAPFTGTWRPVGRLSTLLDDPVDGVWTFKLVDGLPGDRGSLRAVSLHLNGYR
ncbi:S8 family serine peptidase [Saccharothrix violaceirubra]|uniref:Subtilisin-like proprotein convertase family protein n=1 Tax=Saccharothrix violaceirubra TaxID=413306 RepID=A0A7W7T1A0_9PSEU|nr:S8 family serine peptidase [Saccharothrix violaceirubra]MBB4964701.1 subtilisin-like proprotein convertase family protein [Saccharothrix violaceirubra]